MNHTDPAYTFLVILALVLLWLLNRFLNALKKKLECKESPELQVLPEIEVLPEAPKKIIEKRNSIKSNNEQRNFEKAYLKARRQGHQRFWFHDGYYETGLKLVDGTGR